MGSHAKPPETSTTIRMSTRLFRTLSRLHWKVGTANVVIPDRKALEAACRKEWPLPYKVGYEAGVVAASQQGETPSWLEADVTELRIQMSVRNTVKTYRWILLASMIGLEGGVLGICFAGLYENVVTSAIILTMGISLFASGIYAAVLMFKKNPSK